MLSGGLKIDCRKQKAAILQGVAGVEAISVKRYRNLFERVKRAMESCDSQHIRDSSAMHISNLQAYIIVISKE